MYPDIIGGVAQIASTYIQGKTSERNTDKTNKANKELAEYAYSKDQEQWERQNAYNSPAEQMKRFAEAGLNPNLMYGHGTPGNASQMPQYQAPRQEYNYQPQYDPASALNEFMNIKQKDANIASTEASIELQKQQTEVQETIVRLQSAQYHGIIQDNTIKAVEAYISDRMMSQLQTHDSKSADNVAKQRWLAKEADAVSAQLNRDITAWKKSMTDQGLNPNDNILYRQLAETLQAVGLSPQDIRKTINKKTQNRKK